MHHRKTKVLYVVIFLSLLRAQIVWATGPTCLGSFVNPMTDLCWSCIFPMTIGATTVASSAYPDTENPKAPFSICPRPPPIFVQIGLNIGYWEPYAMTDVTRIPWCMVSMGLQLNGPKKEQIGQAYQDHDAGKSSAFYHVHWYRYPVVYWLQLMESAACMQTDAFDLMYMTELDPLWDDDGLSFLLNPEAVLFGQPAAQLSCSTEAIAVRHGKKRPFDSLFWCLGSQGSLYPLTGNTGYCHSTLQTATLLNARLNFKLHREGLVWDSRGRDREICRLWLEPFLPKSRYRYQLTRPYPHRARCYPYGTTTLDWEGGYDPPVGGGSFGFMNFRKRNCVFM